jgi:hypothetical protein
MVIFTCRVIFIDKSGHPPKMRKSKNVADGEAWGGYTGMRQT